MEPIQQNMKPASLNKSIIIVVLSVVVFVGGVFLYKYYSQKVAIDKENAELEAKRQEALSLLNEVSAGLPSVTEADREKAEQRLVEESKKENYSEEELQKKNQEAIDALKQLN